MKRFILALNILALGTAAYLYVVDNGESQQSVPSTMPSRAAQWYQMALGYLEKGTSDALDRAEEYFENVLQEEENGFHKREARYQLGKMYADIDGKKYDFDKAERYLLAAYEQSYDDAMSARAGVLLGGLYYRDRKHANYQQAALLLRAIMEQDDDVRAQYEARFHLAVMHELGLGDFQVTEETVNLYQAVAQQSDFLDLKVKALERLGMIHNEGLGLITQDKRKARAYFNRVLLYKGFPSEVAAAQYQLGALDYENGRMEQAINMWQKVVEQNDNQQVKVKALLGLAHAYLNGNGVERDPVQARFYYKQVLEIRDSFYSPYAQLLLGQMYRDGIGGPVDKKKAREYLRAAAQQDVNNNAADQAQTALSNL